MDVSTDECPVSAITSESGFILRLVSQAASVKESGGVLFGADASKWPAWYYDAVDVTQGQLAKYMNVLNK